MLRGFTLTGAFVSFASNLVAGDTNGRPPRRRAPTTGEASRWDALLEKPYSRAREELLLAFERDYLERVLDTTNGRVGESARLAGLNERTLYAMMKRHGLRKERFKEAR